MKISLFQKISAFGCIVLLTALLCNLWAAQPAQAAVEACAPNIHSGMITTNETWCAGDAHYITADLTVQAGVTLTIQPGVTVTGPVNSWGQYLIVQGHLDVLGSAAQPVLMTSSGGQVVAWGGIYFDGSAGDGSGTINYATIEYTGSNLGAYGAVHAVLVADLPAGKSVTIDHSIIQKNRGKGVHVVNSTVNLTNNTFSTNPYPVYIEGAASVVTYSGNTFTGNAYGYPSVNYPIAEDGIFIGPGALMNHDFSLPAQTGLEAYVFPAGTTIPAGRKVTVQPGLAVRTGNGALTVKGQLDAVGSAGAPIQITGIPHSDDITNIYQWQGLIFDGRDGGGTGHLAYATISHAAENMTEYGPYGLLVRDTPALGQVLIENSAVQDNPYTGVKVVNGNLALTNSTVQRNRWAMMIAGASSQVPLTTNTFTNNLYNYVYIDPLAMTGHDINLSLQTGLDAFYLTDTFTLPFGKTLTVQPGVTVRTAASKYLIVQGSLQALGSSAQPIRFSDPNENNAVWGGLIFDGPAGASGHLDHTIIEHGCDWWNGQGCANLIIYNLMANKTVVVEHSILQNSNVTGLRVINSPTAQVNGNLIKGGQYGAYLASNLTVSNLAAIDQTLDAVVVETGSSVEARHLTIARAGRSGFDVRTGATGLLKNSILSHNLLAVWAEGSAVVSLNTNLADANTTFKSGSVTELRTISGAAAFAADGYHIQPNSLAVGRGMAGLSTGDIDGNTRPWPAGSLPDLGVDEISAGRFATYMPKFIR